MSTIRNNLSMNTRPPHLRGPADSRMKVADHLGHVDGRLRICLVPLQTKRLSSVCVPLPNDQVLHTWHVVPRAEDSKGHCPHAPRAPVWTEGVKSAHWTPISSRTDRRRNSAQKAATPSAASPSVSWSSPVHDTRVPCNGNACRT